MKKVLFISYYFPPLGGAGVQRVAKFVKYLPQFGYEPVVVACSASECKTTEDSHLQAEVQNVKRYEIQMLERDMVMRRFGRTPVGRFLNIHLKDWLGAAIRTCDAAVKAEQPDLICVSVSPYPAARAAQIISRRYRIPWVLDMRDPWALDPINYYQTKAHYLLDLHHMQKACRGADAVIMNTPDSLNAAIERFTEVDSGKFHCITNGWDAEDFKDFTFPKILQDNSRPLTIVHTGVFHTKYAVEVNPSARENIHKKGLRLKDKLKYSVGSPNLLTRTPYYLFEAVGQLLGEGKIKETDIRMIFLGAYTPEDVKLAQQKGVENLVEFRGYQSHGESISILHEADVLFLPLHEPQKGKLPLIVPGKTYEYLAAGRPILALVPEGDAARFVKQSGMGYVCSPTEVKAIASTLFDLFTNFRSQAGISLSVDAAFLSQFERKNLSQKLAGIFDKMV